MRELQKLICYMAILCLAVVACSTGSSGQASNCTVDYYVSTHGDYSSATGAFDAPFKTIGKAQSVIRNSSNRTTCNINVNINDGIYMLSAPLTFESNDSAGNNNKITYKAINKGKVFISGGAAVDGFSSIGNNKYQATVSNVSDNLMPRQFYVDGQRGIRARSNYSELGAYGIESYFIRESNGYLYDNFLTPPLNLTNPNLIEAVTVTQWKMMRCPIESIVPSAGSDLLVMQNPCWNNANTYPSPWNFQLLSWLENAPEFVTFESSWYYNPNNKQILYYSANSTPINAVLPVLDKLLVIQGAKNNPVRNLVFDGLVFEYATWYEPNSINGYVSDQSSFILKGGGYESNIIGHQKIVYDSGSNISLGYAQNITFQNNQFTHLGGVGVALYLGSQNNKIINNVFNDISSSAIQVGSVTRDYMRPDKTDVVKDNLVQNNYISYTGQDYYDTAGIMIGYTNNTQILNNDISHTPWSSVAIGWGWGLFDKGGFPGLPGATYGMWGNYITPTIQSNNLIKSNKFSYFLEQLWDGGAVYTNGSQGTDMSNGLQIVLNVANNKRESAGSNIYYTDGGSQYILVESNASYENRTGTVYFGPCLIPGTLIPYGSAIYKICLGNQIIPYGAEMGGCLPVGDLTYKSNYFENPLKFFGPELCHNSEIPPYPVNLLINNNIAESYGQIPNWIIEQAGVQN